MISLPESITIYPQRQSDPAYLLCWIPARAYRRVVRTKVRRAELRKLYPQGVEIELSDEGLEETGVALPVEPERLRQAYLDLARAGLLPESGLVGLEALQAYLEEARQRPRPELTAALADQLEHMEELGEDDLMRRIAQGPPMSEGEDPADAYRRLAAPQPGQDEEADEIEAGG
jgi:hypothetical protein